MPTLTDPDPISTSCFVKGSDRDPISSALSNIRTYPVTNRPQVLKHRVSKFLNEKLVYATTSIKHYRLQNWRGAQVETNLTIRTAEK